MPSSILSLVVSLVLSLPLGGCYYAFGTKPSTAPKSACTSSRALPIADTVIAGYGAAGLGFGAWALLAIRDDGSLSAGEAKATAGLLAVTGAVMFVGNGLSARAGYRDTARCRARHAPPIVVPDGPPGSVLPASRGTSQNGWLSPGPVP